MRSVVFFSYKVHRDGESKVVRFIRSLKPVRVILLLCCNVFLTVCLWALITVVSIPEFDAFLDEVDSWYEANYVVTPHTLLSSPFLVLTVITLTVCDINKAAFGY